MQIVLFLHIFVKRQEIKRVTWLLEFRYGSSKQEDRTMVFTVQKSSKCDEVSEVFYVEF